MTHPLRSTGINPLQHYKETDSPRQLDYDDAAMTYERFIRCGSAKPVANYYEAVRPSPAHQYFRPRGWSRLRLFPWHRRPGSHVPYKSPIELRAASMPDAAWAVSVHPPSLSRRNGNPPVFTSSIRISTRHQRFACARLSQSYLPKSRSDFSATFTTIAFDDSSLRWLEINT